MNPDIKQLKQGGTIVKLNPTDTMEEILSKTIEVRPSEDQIVWQELEFIAFIHFGINTFTNREWGDGTESLELFNPVDLDAEQWVKAIKDAEMKAVILTCKHHDGFCLWPSQYTDYSVKNSPWREGKGDVVRDVATACQKYGIKFAIYLSPWDRHEPSYGDSDAYNTYYKKQLTELLTNYGDVIDVWLDGACAEGPNGKKQVYDWRGFYETVRTLQPHATITGMGPDARWCGNEAGTCRTNEWSPVPVPGMDGTEAECSDVSAISFCNHNHSLAMTEDLGSRETLKNHAQNSDWITWYPAQVDTSIRPGWFYHEKEDTMVKSLKHLMDIYYQSVGGNAQLLLNLPPTKNGLLHSTDVTRLKQMGDVIRRTFKHNLLDGAAITTHSTEDSTIIQISFEKPATFNTLMIQEDISQGQRVERFHVEIKENNTWTQIGEGTVIGYKKLLRLSEEGFITATKLRITISESRALPLIKQLGLYKAPILVSEPQITRSQDGLVSIIPRLSAVIHYTTDGSTPNEESPRYSEPFALPYGGTIKAIAYYTEGNEDFYIEENITASKTFGVCKNNWKVISSSGGEVLGSEKENILSEDPSLYLKASESPYRIDIDMGEILTLSGFSFMPVSEGYDFNYNTYIYSFYTSLDGINWDAQKHEASFDNISHNPILQIVQFEKQSKARYIRFEAIRTIQGNGPVVIGEISAML